MAWLGKNRFAAVAYWAGAALAVIGGIVPMIQGGQRMPLVILPFVLAAVLMGANALTNDRGPVWSSAFFIVAAAAIAYGILDLASLPVRLAVSGGCTGPASSCSVGFEPPMHDYEWNAVTAGGTLGVLSLIAGAFGLLAVYRHRPKH